MAILPSGGSTDLEVPPAPVPAPPARRGPLTGLALCLAVVLAFGVVVVALNSGVYSAGGFVSRYLDALERRDLAVALSMPGVELPASASRAALTREGLGRIDGHSIVGERDGSGGRRIVTAEYRLGSRTARSDFVVESAPRIAFLFSGWRFAESPATVLEVTALHAATFRLNGIELDAPDLRTGGEWTSTLAVLAPGRFTLDESSRYLRADPVAVDVTDAAPTPGTVEVRPAPALTAAVAAQVHDFLDSCVTQQVLNPAGCPFGEQLTDRVLAPPTWSMVTYPEIDLQPVASPTGISSWSSPSAAVAHIRADVVSLFDGTRSTVDRDVPFQTTYLVTIRSDGGLDIRVG